MFHAFHPFVCHHSFHFEFEFSVKMVFPGPARSPAPQGASPCPFFLKNIRAKIGKIRNMDPNTEDTEKMIRKEVRAASPRQREKKQGGSLSFSRGVAKDATPSGGAASPRQRGKKQGRSLSFSRDAAKDATPSGG
jgi:hypothetical protein